MKQPILLLLLLSTLLFAGKVDPVLTGLQQSFAGDRQNLTKLSVDKNGLFFVQTFWQCKEERILISPKKKTFTVKNEGCGEKKFKITKIATSNEGETIRLTLDVKGLPEGDTSNVVTLHVEETTKELRFRIENRLLEEVNGLYILTIDQENYETYCLDCQQEKQERLEEEIKELFN